MMRYRYSCQQHVGAQLLELSDDRHNVTVEPRRYGANARGDGLPRCGAGECIQRVAWWLVVRTYGHAGAAGRG